MLGLPERPWRHLDLGEGSLSPGQSWALQSGCNARGMQGRCAFLFLVEVPLFQPYIVFDLVCFSWL